MTRLFIIADDITGAADAAAPFATNALTAVRVTADSPATGAVVESINTETRNANVRAAAEHVRVAVQSVQAEPNVRIVKKIDSLMRGHVGAEVSVLLREMRAGAGEKAPIAIVAPAFPAVGRTLVKGQVFVDGLARKNANVIELLHGAGVPTKLITKEILRTPARFARELIAASQKEISVVVDGVSDEDLRRAVRGVETANIPSVMVGSGGITGALAEREFEHGASPSLSTRPRPGERPLVVAGSYAATSRAQVKRLVAAGFTHVSIAPTQVPDVSATVRAALRKGGCVVSIAEEGGVDLSQSDRIAGLLAECTIGSISLASSLIVSGGHTAFTILRRLRASQIVIEGEVAPGVVASSIPGYEPQLITKSGAFGDEHTLLRVASTIPTL